jgi:tRNA A-37 threonylcarbamoyl transferase component Bud32
MAAPSVGEIDAIYTKFGEIISKNAKRELNGFIEGLSANQGERNLGAGTERYTDHASMLENLTFTPSSDTTGTIQIGRTQEPVRRIGGGTYGTIFLGTTTKTVYKRVVRDPAGHRSIEEFHRELFIEPFVQTVLQMDDTYGTNIAKISGVYRDSSVPTRLQRTTRRRTAAPINNSAIVYTYWYVMESIDYTLDRYVDSMIQNNETRLRDVLYGHISSLGTILGYFQRKYGFYHRDLHTGNVMFKQDGSNPEILKLIDFGMSTVSLNGVQYAIQGGSNFSYDLLIFLGAMYSNHTVDDATFNQELVSYITPNFYAQMEEQVTDGKAVTPWHTLYYWFLDQTYHVYTWIKTQEQWDNFYNQVGPKFHDMSAFSNFWATKQIDEVRLNARGLFQNRQIRDIKKNPNGGWSIRACLGNACQKYILPVALAATTAFAVMYAQSHRGGTRKRLQPMRKMRRRNAKTTRKY